MPDKNPICAPYLLKYNSYFELDSKSKNLVEIIKYGDYNLKQKNLKNITEVIKKLRLNNQPELLKKLQKKYISLYKKKTNSLSWKNKSSISIPKSLKIDSIIPIQKSITVAGKINKKIKGKKSQQYTVRGHTHLRQLKNKKYSKKNPKTQSGGSASPSKKGTTSPKQVLSVDPRVLLVDPKSIPTSPYLKLIETISYSGGIKKNLRCLFRLDFELPDGSMQKLFFKVAVAPNKIKQDVSLSSPLAKSNDFRYSNSFIYESNVYHTMNMYTSGTVLNQNILNIFGYGYTSETNPKFVVKYDSSSNRIVGTHIPTSDNVSEIELNIPEAQIALITALFTELDKQKDSSKYISYNITEFLDDYIPLKYSKIINSSDKIHKIILKASDILNTLYYNFGFVHGDLHDLNYLVKDTALPEGELPENFIKFYDFDLSLLVNHRKLIVPRAENWLGYVNFIFEEIYSGILGNRLILFGKILSIYDYYRLYCDCSLHYQNGTCIFDFYGMTYFEKVYLEELSDKQYIGKHEFFVKILEKKSYKNDFNTEVIKLSLEFKNNIIDSQINKKRLLERFDDRDYQIIKKLLEKGFLLNTEHFTYTLPWWFTIWCVVTDENGLFYK